MTLNNYITHPTGARPKGPGAHMGVLWDQVTSWSLGLAAISNRTTGHSYCQKSKMVTANTKNKIYNLNRFTHYIFLLSLPHAFDCDLWPPPSGGHMPCHPLPPLPD